jgi:predicted HTH domain antitoxin
MVNLIVAVPENVLFTLRTDDVEFAGSMKKYTALKLYEAQKLSLGQSAELAGMDKQNFIGFLSENCVSIFSHMSKEDLTKDVENA